MENQEYLNQISAEVRPTKKSKMGNILHSPILKISLIAVVVLALIGIANLVISGLSGNPKEEATELLLHIDNTSEVINTYQPNLKSSTLRSSSASLGLILSNTSRELTDYMTEKYNYKSNTVDKKLVTDADLHKDGLESALADAKINGILDRIYAHKMAYEITLILEQEKDLYKTTKDESLRTLINTSLNSLNNLYAQFSDYSEAK